MAAPTTTPLVVAGAGDDARPVSAMAVALGRARGGEVHALHVVEEDILPSSAPTRTPGR